VISEKRRTTLIRRIGWSLGAASLWTWGLFAIRMVRDGLQPLEVWFGYGLSFYMTAVYAYMGMLIYATLRDEAPPFAQTLATLEERAAPLGRLRRPIALIGVIGLVIATVSVIAWLVLRYPGARAVSGTYGSVILAAMILGVAVVATLIANGARTSNRGEKS
jgi:hypothetical protein